VRARRRQSEVCDRRRDVRKRKEEAADKQSVYRVFFIPSVDKSLGDKRPCTPYPTKTGMVSCNMTSCEVVVGHTRAGRRRAVWFLTRHGIRSELFPRSESLALHYHITAIRGCQEEDYTYNGRGRKPDNMVFGVPLTCWFCAKVPSEAYDSLTWARVNHFDLLFALSNRSWKRGVDFPAGETS